TNNLTTNTLVQGAMALLLSQLSGERDIVYGVTFAGRPPALPGVDSIMGLLIHSLPLRVPVVANRPLLPWLESLLQTQVAIEPYSYTPLHAIQEWCDHPQPLFHCNLRFQNFPMDDALRQRWGEELAIRNATMVDWWHYPVNIVVTPGAQLNLAMTFDTRVIDERQVGCWLADLERILASFVEQPHALLSVHCATLV
ncbi:MAG: condensation domain-containing protein, partial [Caldilineaceae bacterium]